MESGNRLLISLLKASEKAANIARICRQDKALFKLLIQEKSGTEKNPSFFQDFKTLADVLIQATIKHDIGVEFPELSKMIQGEETNAFTNTLGETITVEVRSTYEETMELLANVMNGDMETAESLAIEVHRNIQYLDMAKISDIPYNFFMNTNDLGIWIDPIDATGEYVQPATNEISGLHCVAVLIGVYLKSTGLPILGIVNKPFSKFQEDGRWRGSAYWGYSHNDINISSIRISEFFGSLKKTIMVGRSEDSNLKSKLEEAGFILVETSGAGHKILSVALGLAAAYVLSKGSTYKWDTCGPQAILRSVGGGVIDFNKFVMNPDSDELDLKYSFTDTDKSNNGGLIAYRSTTILTKLKDILC